jgi:hypothetical protein
VLQNALKPSNGNIVRLINHTPAFPQDFQWLAEDMGAPPTDISKIVPDAVPSTRGACDASGKGITMYTLFH